ncbi:MAG: hypothetical protein FWH31_09295 [Streptococcaceae bacterium]|nr:hypothetical protein [Streptococcaceae bacterium]
MKKILQNKWTKRISFSLLLLIFFIIGMLFSPFNRPQESPQPEIQAGGVTTEAPAESAEQLRIPVIGLTYVDSHDKIVQMPLENPEINNATFQYSISLKDSEEILFTSPILKPGEKLESWEMSRMLDKGEHALTIHIDARSLDGLTQYNNAVINTKIYIG